jgi:hypothetical protein
MGVLGEKLMGVGLLSKEQFQRQQAVEELKEMEKNTSQISELAKKTGKKGCEGLEECKTMREFKALAKDILMKDPSKIKIIIQEAHRFKNDDQGKKFVWFFYQLRDVLVNLPASKREQFLNGAFRRHNSTLTPKED